MTAVVIAVSLPIVSHRQILSLLLFRCSPGPVISSYSPNTTIEELQRRH